MKKQPSLVVEEAWTAAHMAYYRQNLSKPDGSGEVPEPAKAWMNAALACHRAFKAIQEGEGTRPCPSDCYLGGYDLAAMHDPAGRRGLWFRAEKNVANDVLRFHVCAGREGGDAEVHLVVGSVVTPTQMHALDNAFGYASWAYDLALQDPTTAEHHAARVAELAEEVATLMSAVKSYKKRIAELEARAEEK